MLSMRDVDARSAFFLLLILPPLLAELLTASSPPLRFFHPLALVVLLCLYGGGVLLIREARARWGLGLSILSLAVAYGVLEEGLAVQSFFHVAHPDLGALRGRGIWLGVQWPWSVAVTFVHATVSTLVPIAIVDTLFPDLRRVPLLRRRGLIVAAAAVAASTLFLMVVTQASSGAPSTLPGPLSLLVTAFVVSGLVVLAWVWRRVEVPRLPAIRHRPATLGLLAALAQIANLVAPNALAKHDVGGVTIVLVQSMLLGGLLIFALSQIARPDFGRRQVGALVTGTLAPFVVLSIPQGLGAFPNPDPTTGMIAVGMGALVALWLWWRRHLLKSVDDASTS